MRYLFFVVAILLFSCNQSTENKIESTKKSPSEFTNLLSKFKNISFDTLKVNSSNEESDSAWKFNGTELDSTDAKLFPLEIPEGFFNESGLFACYKFNIDSDRIALISRTPGEYVSSSIKLFIYQKSLDKITDYTELADSWGDAGDWRTLDSWLFIDNNKNLHSFTWEQVGHDNSVENEKDTTTELYNYYYLIDLSKQPIDTISKDSVQLSKLFKGLIEKD
jgi:hypothetical protein